MTNPIETSKYFDSNKYDMDQISAINYGMAMGIPDNILARISYPWFSGAMIREGIKMMLEGVPWEDVYEILRSCYASSLPKQRVYAQTMGS